MDHFALSGAVVGHLLIEKAGGDTVGAVISVQHVGRGGVYYVGFGVARSYMYQPPDPDVDPIWIRDPIAFFVYTSGFFNDDDSQQGYTFSVNGMWPGGLINGEYDCFVFVLHPSRAMRPDAYGYNAGMWVEWVYQQVSTGGNGFSGLGASDWL